MEYYVIRYEIPLDDPSKILETEEYFRRKLDNRTGLRFSKRTPFGMRWTGIMISITYATKEDIKKDLPIFKDFVHSATLFIKHPVKEMSLCTFLSEELNIQPPSVLS